MTSHHYLHTGQRTCDADDGREVPCEGSGQDASFAAGTYWPEPRFDLHNDEVLDRLTGPSGVVAPILRNFHSPGRKHWISSRP